MLPTAATPGSAVVSLATKPAIPTPETPFANLAPLTHFGSPLLQPPDARVVEPTPLLKSELMTVQELVQGFLVCNY